VPAGSSLVVQTDDAVTAVKAMRATIYTANVAEDVVDLTEQRDPALGWMPSGNIHGARG
jgi:hypothetical protein